MADDYGYDQFNFEAADMWLQVENDRQAIGEDLRRVLARAEALGMTTEDLKLLVVVTGSDFKCK